MSRRVWPAMVCLLWLVSLTAAAQTRAWLDRDHITLGETVTLNIETDADASPDYAPLRAGFELSGRTSRRQVELSRGQMVSRTLYAVALRPLRDGVLTVPGLLVGTERTDPLPLVVAPARADAEAMAGSDLFLESGPDDPGPYVQQAVGWVVRLYAATPLLSGQLDQPAPEGASLRQVGEDLRYNRRIEGRDYRVIERRYLLVPERSGELLMPGAVFRGRGVAGFFDDLFGRDGVLEARAAARRIPVRPVPAQASVPWRPLHGLQLRYAEAPQSAQAGAATTLVIQAEIDGATVSEAPELQLPPIDGAQVFAEPVQADERWVDGRPRVTLRRQFSLVPTRAGTVNIPKMALDWWDVDSDQARTASLPAFSLDVAAAVQTTTGGPAGTGDTATSVDATSGVSGTSDGRRWAIAAVVFALLWLVTLMWGMHRTPARTPLPKPGLRPAAADAGPVDLAGFRKALDHGGFDELTQRLCDLAQPPAQGLDEVRARLSDPAQVAAVDALQRACWGGGDGVHARRQLRAAFASAPRWIDVDAGVDGSAGAVEKAGNPLPPLYPRNGRTGR